MSTGNSSPYRRRGWIIRSDKGLEVFHQGLIRNLSSEAGMKLLVAILIGTYASTRRALLATECLHRCQSTCRTHPRRVRLSPSAKPMQSPRGGPRHARRYEQTPPRCKPSRPSVTEPHRNGSIPSRMPPMSHVGPWLYVLNGVIMSRILLTRLFAGMFRSVSFPIETENMHPSSG